MNLPLASLFGSFALSLVTTLALRPIAIAVNLVDRSGGRKTHHGDVPVIGGLSIFVGIVFGFGLQLGAQPTAGALLAACAVIVGLGLADDRFDLSPWIRLAVQSGAAVLLMLGTNTFVVTLGAAFGEAEVALEGWVSAAFTIATIGAVVNAFNMLDGIDGLATAIAIVALAGVALLGAGGGGGAITASLVCSITLGAAFALKAHFLVHESLTLRD